MMAVGFGPGDCAMDLGPAWSKEGLEYYYDRSKMPSDAVVGVPALDGPYTDSEGLEVFRRDCSISRRPGYKGRRVVHPSQVGPANEAYRPSPLSGPGRSRGRTKRRQPAWAPLGSGDGWWTG